MKSPLLITCSPASATSTTQTRFIGLTGGTGSTWSTSRPIVETPIATAGTFSKLAVRCPTALSPGQSYTFTVVKNGVDTALTVTINDAGIFGVDAVNTAAFAQGDLFAVKVVPSGTPAVQEDIQISLIFESTTVNQGLISSGHTASTATTKYFPPSGLSATSAPDESVRIGNMPTDGEIDTLYVNLNVAPGVGNSRTYTVRKNGADTGLTVTFGAAELGIKSVVAAVSYIAGDHLSFALTSTGTPASGAASLSVRWKPTTAGEAVLFGTQTGGLSASSAGFGAVNGSMQATGIVESEIVNIAPAAITLSKLRYEISAAPGAAKSRTVRLRKNLTDGNQSLVFTGTLDTELYDYVNTDSFAAGDRLSFSSTPASTPATSNFGRFSAVATVDAGGGGVAFSSSDRVGQTFEGIINTSAVQVGGTYSGSPTDVQIELIDGLNNVVASVVSASVQAGGVYSHTFSGVPVGGPYRHRVRDNGGAWTTSTAEIFVGAVVVLWGQSQCQRLHTFDTSGLQPTAGMNNVRILTYSSQTNVSNATSTITRFQNGTVGLATITGSGAVAIANQWYADVGNDVPLLIVVCAYQGTGINLWIDNEKGDWPTNADVTTLWGVSPTTGFAWFMANAAKYQASAVVMMQGTSNSGTDPEVYKGYMDALKAKFESLYAGMNPLFLVVPHNRSNDGVNTHRLRAAQYEKATSGGNWRVCCHIHDWQLDGNGSAHQAAGASGNIRGGLRIGRGLAKHLDNSALDIEGPLAIASSFNEAGNAFVITFDRNVELPDASTTGIPGFVVSTDNFATTTRTGFSAARTAANQITVTKDSGTWSAGLRWDYMRGIPYGSDVAYAAEYVGIEANMETNFLAKVVCDTSAFDGGRGLPMHSQFGTGRAIAAYGAPSNSNRGRKIAVRRSTRQLQPWSIS